MDIVAQSYPKRFIQPNNFPVNNIASIIYRTTN